MFSQVSACFRMVVVTVGSNLEAAKSGDHLKALEATRDTLAEALDAAMESGAGTVAQIAAQLRATLAEVASLKAKGTKGQVEDEVAKRRAARDDTFDASAI